MLTAVVSSSAAAANAESWFFLQYESDGKSEWLMRPARAREAVHAFTMVLSLHAFIC